MRTQAKNFNSRLAIYWNVKNPIMYNVVLAKLANSATAGLFMSQLLYWWGKGKKSDWIYKTVGELKEETYLSRSQQATAIRIWEDFGVLEVKRKGIPATRHFKIHVEHIMALVEWEFPDIEPNVRFEDTEYTTYEDYLPEDCIS